MKPIIDRNTALTIAPKLEINYKPEQKTIKFRNLGARPNSLGYIVAGIQFLKSLHGKRGDYK
jgi:hypothetical protein